MKSIRSISIIGTGNVAFHLGKAFRNVGIEIADVFGRNRAEAEKLSKILDCRSINSVDECSGEIILCCISDRSISDLSKLISTEKRVVHTSGSVSLSALAKHAQHGVFYPLQTFSKERPILFGDVPILIEGNTSEMSTLLLELAKKLSQSTKLVNSDDRLKFHLSAVFVNNFTNHLVFKAKELVEENQLDWEMLLPLLNETVSKLKEIGPFDAQTGPAKRQDMSTIDLHLSLLTEENKKIYQILSDSIEKTYNSTK